MFCHTEKELQNQCLKWLKSQSDIWFFKVVGSPTQKSGIPDIIICKNGKFVGAELKTPKGTGKESGQQEIIRKQIQRAGGISFVTNNFEEFKRIIGEIK